MLAECSESRGEINQRPTKSRCGPTDGPNVSPRDDTDAVYWRMAIDATQRGTDIKCWLAEVNGTL